MRRKLVQQGSSTLMVSLPAKWIKFHGLGKGSEVSLQEVNGDLLCSAEESPKKKKTEIRLVSKTESAIRTTITNAYRRGYDQIIVHFSVKEQFKILNDVIKSRLIGFDITKKEKNFCVVESITEPSGEQFETILQKIFLNVQSLFTATENFLEGEDVREEVKEIEERIQKYDNFCRRVIMRRERIAHPELYWSFLTLLIHAQRELYHLTNQTGKRKSERVKKILQLSEKIFQLVNEGYRKKDSVLLERAHDLEKELQKEGNNLLKKLEGEEVIIVHYLINAGRQFYLASSPLMGIILS